MKKIKGQSLTEILIALAIGVAFINVGIMAMSTANILAKVNKANNFALSLLKSQRSILETISENGWHSIADLTIGKHYKLAKQNNSLIIQAGEEKVFDEKPPVAQWNFDEGAGTLAYDNVGTNNGTLINSPTWTTSSSCVSGSCLGFNGSSDYVDVSYQPTFRNALTCEIWIKRTTGYNQLADVMFLSPPNAWYFYDSYNSGNIRGDVYIDGTRRAGLNVPVAFDSNWYHIVYTYDSATHIAKIYKNGTLYDSIIINGLTNYLIDAATGNLYGMGKNSLGRGIVLDEPRIYDYALTENQVQQHYNAGLNRLGLVSQWGMDEGSGAKAYDSQGGNDGTLTNMEVTTVWQANSNCVSGGCLSFDGVDDYIAIGVGNDYFPLPLFSICAWVKSPGLASGMSLNGILSLTYGLSMFLDSAGTFQARVDNGSTFTSVSTLGNLHDNKFHNVCMTFDNTYMHAFVDGVWKNKSATTWLGTTRWPTNTCNIGCENNNCPIYRFNGYIDDVRIYNRALTADEIANQYKDGYTKYFYVNNVSRDIASDPTASTHDLETTYVANHDDPNTKKIVNVTRYLLGTPGRVNTQEQYLARAANINSLVQTDWSDNSGVTGPEIDFGNNYYSTSNLTLSTAGQMSLTSTASNGTLASTIIDTQSINGSGYFNLLWQGDALCSGCSVKFQIAASNCSNGASNYPTCNTGTWTYYGPTATSDYYIPSGPGIPVPITYAGQYSALSSSVQNKRYVRYYIMLVPASSISPVVKDVIINYAQ